MNTVPNRVPSRHYREKHIIEPTSNFSKTYKTTMSISNYLEPIGYEANVGVNANEWNELHVVNVKIN